MARFSKNGKPLCHSCRRLATSYIAGRSWPKGNPNSKPVPLYVYHCSNHAGTRDKPIPPEGLPESF